MSRASRAIHEPWAAVVSWSVKIRERLVGSPFQVAATVMAVPIGIVAIALGADISEAMSRVLGNVPEIVRLWGVAIAVGGVVAVYGRYGGRPWLERAGLRLLGPAYGLYGFSVLLGLGRGGMVTGPMFLALAVACFARARLSLRGEAARMVAEEMLNDKRPLP